MTRTYKLVYFDLRALGEPTRYLFKYMRIPFEDFRINPTVWPTIRQNFQWYQLPELHVKEPSGSEYVVTQSSAINRFIARSHPEHNLMPLSALDIAKCDMVVDSLQDIRLSLKPYIEARYFGINKEKIEELRQEATNKKFLKFLGNIEDVLKDNYKSYRKPYISGERLTWADLYLACFAQWWEDVLENCNLLDKFEFIKKHKEEIHGIPEINAWVNDRPSTVI